MKVNIIRANGVKERTVHFFDSAAMQDMIDSLRNTPSPMSIDVSNPSHTDDIVWTTDTSTSVPEKTITSSGSFAKLYSSTS